MHLCNTQNRGSQQAPVLLFIFCQWDSYLGTRAVVQKDGVQSSDGSEVEGGAEGGEQTLISSVVRNSN